MNRRNAYRLKKKRLSEDAIDLRAIRERASEPVHSYETVLKELKKDKLI